MMKKLIFILFVFLNILTLGSSDIAKNNYVSEQYNKEFKIIEELNDYNIIKDFSKNFVKFHKISSPYNTDRLHPVFNIHRPHLGVDLAAKVGTPVHAPYGGEIIWKGYVRGAGYTLEIKHNNIYTTSYLHLSDYNNNYKIGDRINKGDIIGLVGSSGYSTGPHLDFRLYINDVPVDPEKTLDLKVSQINNNQEDDGTSSNQTFV